MIKKRNKIKTFGHSFTGDVTKIEVVLQEAPDAVIVGSMSSELEATTELNSTFPNGESNNFVVIQRKL